jgi:hypothetical protein
MMTQQKPPKQMGGCLVIEYFKENIMTNEQKAILAMVVADPDEWAENSISVFGKQKGEEIIASRVAQLKPQYDLAIADGKYKTKAQEKVEYESSAKYLAKKQAMTDYIAKQATKKQDIEANLKTWKELSDDIASANDVKKLQDVVARLAKVIYWLAKNSDI